MSGLPKHRWQLARLRARDLIMLAVLILFSVLIAVGFGAAAFPIMGSWMDGPLWLGIFLSIALLALGLGWALAFSFKWAPRWARRTALALAIPTYGLVSAAAVLTIGRYVGFSSAFVVGLIATVVLLSIVLLIGRGIGDIAAYRQEGTRSHLIRAGIALALGIGGAFWVTAWLYSPGSGTPMRPTGKAAPSSLAGLVQAAAREGTYRVQYFTYGSGTDLHRGEFANEAKHRSASVDGSAFTSPWTQARRRYWGFDEKSLPLNGRVWMPVGQGTFPLVLIVHGDHRMDDFSDEGYAYLAKLLASRGHIVVSIDENFLNSAPLRYGLATGENGLRGWLLLKHLGQWRAWAAGSGAQYFAARADLSRIMLIGHSRGGDAVAIASYFNQLRSFPEKPHVRFDFGFGIRGIVGLAPILQYRFGNQITPINNVDLLVIHGSQDGDVPNFMGLRLYNKLRFTDGRPHFKSAVYIAGANHNQFNTTWGRSDMPAPLEWLLDKGPQIEPDVQRRITANMVSLFADAVLREQAEAAAAFSDSSALRQIASGVPMITRAARSDGRVLADFDEDVDPLTVTFAGGAASVDGVRLWRESELGLRAAQLFGNQQSQAVYLGWHSEKGPPPSYSINRAEGFGKASELYLSVTDARETALATGFGATRPGKRDVLDFTVEISDDQSRTIRRAVSSIGGLPPLIPIRLTKFGGFEPTESQPILQTLVVPLSGAQTTGPVLGNIRSIVLRFDRSPRGVVAVDDIILR